MERETWTLAKEEEGKGESRGRGETRTREEAAMARGQAGGFSARTEVRVMVKSFIDESQ